MRSWIPERDRSPHARRRYNVRLYRDFPPRLRAVAKAYGLSVGEYIERCIIRDERKLGGKMTQAAIGRQLVENR